MLHSPGEDETPSVVCSLWGLSLLDLHAGTIPLDMLAATVTVRLHASKGDLRGRTAARTQVQVRRTSCPFCSALFLVKLATDSWKPFAVLEIGRPMRQDRYHSSRLVTTHVISWKKTHMVHALSQV